MNKKDFWTSFQALLKGMPKNKKVMTADMEDVDFYELLEDEPIEVGANATIDGKPAEGEVVMQSGETYVFAAGVLTEIRPKVEDNTGEDDTAALEAKIADLETQLAAANAKAETLSVSNKKLTGVIAKIEALQADFDDDETGKEKPKAKTKEVENRPVTAAVASYVKRTKNLNEK